MTKFKFALGQTVYYDAQEDPNRPIRARIDKRISPRKYRVVALWAVDPDTGKDRDGPGGFLNYKYDMDAHDLRTTLRRGK